MKARAPQMVIKPDYRQFRLRKLNTPEFSHIKLLLFWPVFGLAFLALERVKGETLDELVGFAVVLRDKAETISPKVDN